MESPHFAARLARSRQILEDHPDCVPIQLVPHDKGVEFTNALMVAPKGQRMGHLIHATRKRVKKLLPSHALYIFVNHRLCTAGTLVSDVYRRDADDDGMLYLTVARECTFGGNACGRDAGSDVDPEWVRTPARTVLFSPIEAEEDRIQYTPVDPILVDRQSPNRDLIIKARIPTELERPSSAGPMGQSQSHKDEVEALMQAAGVSQPTAQETIEAEPMAQSEEPETPLEHEQEPEDLDANLVWRWSLLQPFADEPVDRRAVERHAFLTTCVAAGEPTSPIRLRLDQALLTMDGYTPTPPNSAPPSPTGAVVEHLLLPEDVPALVAPSIMREHGAQLAEKERAFVPGVIDAIVEIADGRSFVANLVNYYVVAMEHIEIATKGLKGDKKVDKSQIAAYAVSDAAYHFGVDIDFYAAQEAIQLLFDIKKGNALSINRTMGATAGLLASCFGRN